MRPITNTIPKPLVKVAGSTLLDRGLDTLAAAGVEKAVVNVHHFPEQIVAHVASRAKPEVAISDESAGLLDSAGGIVKALPKLGREPFYILNADTFWIEEEGSRRDESNLARLALAWDAVRMDILLMLADLDSATGHTGGTDFLVGGDGVLRRAHGDPAGLIYAGAAIVNPAIFAGAPEGPQSLNRYFDDGDRQWPAVRHDDARSLDHRRHAGRDPARRSRGRAGACRSGMSERRSSARLHHPARRGLPPDAGRRAAVGPAVTGLPP